jgi:hypothetical protein
MHCGQSHTNPLLKTDVEHSLKGSLIRHGLAA